MAKAEDKKQLFADALMEMMDSIPLDQITVSSLVRACGLSRQTFYYHFQTLEDLMAWALHREFLEASKNVRGEGSLDQLRAILERMYEKRGLLEKASHCKETSRSIDELIKQELGIHVMRSVEEASAGLGIAPQDRALIARFYTAGLLEIIRIWIDDGMRESPERLTERLGLFLVNSSELLARFSA